MTLVLIVAGIDLSVGSVMGFCAAVVGVAAVAWGLPLWMACLLGLGTGLICGAVNGLLVAYFSLPSFIVTLGMLEMARGLAYLTTGFPDHVHRLCRFSRWHCRCRASAYLPHWFPPLSS